VSQARNTTVPDERGMYRTWCDPCGSSAEYPELFDAVLARQLHLCHGETPSCSWPGWALGMAPP
jgi:hypothetical protein